MECEWCGEEFSAFSSGGGFRTCSHDCYDRYIQYAAAVVKAQLDGEELPSRDEFRRNPRARRWTPERMQARVDAFRTNTEPWFQRIVDAARE